MAPIELGARIGDTSVFSFNGYRFNDSIRFSLSLISLSLLTSYSKSVFEFMSFLAFGSSQSMTFFIAVLTS